MRPVTQVRESFAQVLLELVSLSQADPAIYHQVQARRFVDRCAAT